MLKITKDVALTEKVPMWDSEGRRKGVSKIDDGESGRSG